MKTSKILGVTLTLVFSLSALTGCNQPNTPGTNSNSNSSTNSNSTSTKTSVQSTEVKNALASYQETDDLFQDSESLAGDNSKFNTKALGDIVKKVEGSANGQVRAGANGQVKAAVKLNNQQIKKELQESGAVQANEDGTITVDPEKFKEVVNAKRADIKKKVEARTATLKARLDVLAPKLKAKAAVAKDKLEKVRRKNFVVRSSDVVETTNDDGSVTKTVSVEFENSRTGVKRENNVSKTFSADGKPLTIEHYLTMTTKNNTKTATRVVTFNEDGSKTIVTESTTKWNDGRERIVNEERTVNADGSGSGTGTVTVTVNGETKTYTLDTKLSASGEMTTSAANPAENTEVVVEENADGSAEVTIEENGEQATEKIEDIEEATEVEVEANVEADANASA